jgi:hypothetical protein
VLLEFVIFSLILFYGFSQPMTLHVGDSADSESIQTTTFTTETTLNNALTGKISIQKSEDMSFFSFVVSIFSVFDIYGSLTPEKTAIRSTVVGNNL